MNTKTHMTPEPLCSKDALRKFKQHERASYYWRARIGLETMVRSIAQADKDHKLKFSSDYLKSEGTKTHSRFLRGWEFDAPVTRAVRQARAKAASEQSDLEQVMRIPAVNENPLEYALEKYSRIIDGDMSGDQMTGAGLELKRTYRDTLGYSSRLLDVHRGGRIKIAFSNEQIIRTSALLKEAMRPAINLNGRKLTEYRSLFYKRGNKEYHIIDAKNPSCDGQWRTCQVEAVHQKKLSKWERKDAGYTSDQTGWSKLWSRHKIVKMFWAALPTMNEDEYIWALGETLDEAKKECTKLAKRHLVKHLG